ncbi:receptor-like kinase TMK4, partial [Malania oleifera]|uniref:receptor-like kinase TMK4 n=1 Tax=Malania oleifera TaxID=397392 RepID=UPI0025AEC573
MEEGPRLLSLPPSSTHFFLFSLILFFSFSAADDAAVMAKLATAFSPTPRGWSGSNFCKWSSVNCDSTGRVSTISLASRSLSGELPSEINQLSGLKSLSLQRNKLSGPLPSFANLTNLQEIFLDGNGFSSVPPSFLAGLTSLQTFSISENPSLAPWTIPNALADSSSLVGFYASKANVFGTVPDIFNSLPNFQSLKLSYNNLTGPLPASFAGSAIQNLWLNNQAMGLSGRLDALGAMSQLSQVWLHANAFSGPIPDLSKSTSLFDFQLRDNHITGIVPPSLTTLPKLVNVSLQNNNLQGPYPEFGKNAFVSLGSTNSFCNSEPGPCDPQVTSLLAVAGALGYPMTLAESWQGNNACQKWSFITCDSAGKSVTAINFGKQHWTGTISPAVANLTSLKSLVLNDNNLGGSIPESLTGLSQLQILDVSNNNLTGKIPRFPASVTVKTAGNRLLGTNSSSAGGEGSAASGPNVTSTQGPTSFSISKSFAVIMSSVAVIVSLLICYCCLKKRKKFAYIPSPQTDKEKMMKEAVSNRYGHGGLSSELSSHGDADNGDVRVYDGGSVTFPIEVLREVTNNFSKDNVLGKGGFGVVYKAELHDGTKIAVKRMESSVVSSKGKSEFEAEIGVLTKVRHRHLVALLGFCVNGNERLLVYEYMPQGTLGQHLFKCSMSGFSPLSWKQRVTIALDVARGVEYLHSLAQQSFIHRDLKPSNVLLGDDMRAKVSDFGLVKNAPDGNHSVETRLAGTFGYLAPEYASTGRVTTKVDVFAFGVILMELITGQMALDEDMPEGKSHLVTWFRKALSNKENIRNSLDQSLDPDEETFKSICKVAQLAGHCTAREPFQRPDMGHVVTVLAPLVDLWKPMCDENEDSFSIDLHMSLPDALQRWQAGDGTTTMADELSFAE